jgi:hypothetical protein
MRLVTLIWLAGWALTACLSAGPAFAQSPAQDIPAFELDATWPKLPAKWKVGDLSSVAVDSRDHVWVLHRPRTLAGADGKIAAPPVLEFDAAGNFVQAWGGPGAGYEWPEREHGIHVDHTGHVWIGGNNCVGRKLPGLKDVSDDQLLKFTTDGKFVLQIGRSNQSQGNADTRNLRQPSDAVVYPKTNEVFVADGYANHRVIVFDATTGAFKRMWGAFGNTPVDHHLCPPPNPAPVPNDGGRGPDQFDIVHVIRVSDDGLVYVGDRENKRVQVFTVEGKFVDQVFIARENPKVSRTAGALDFSPDAAQRFLYVAGGGEIAILERKTLQSVGSIKGRGGHHMAVDSKGNIYLANMGGGPQRLLRRGGS